MAIRFQFEAKIADPLIDGEGNSPSGETNEPPAGLIEQSPDDFPRPVPYYINGI